MTESARCPQCGCELPANFPPGICPTCLLKQGLSPSTIDSAAGAGSGGSGSGQRRSWTPPTPAELAPRFPQLEIVELLGQGGMGAVYKVRQRELDRWAALKVLPDEVARDPNFAERFQREARALAQLGHQHIVIVYEFGQRDGVYFLLMEYIDGVTLRQAIRAGQVTAKDALGIVTQICDALQFAHEEGVVHRDIKPENILLDKRGRVKIADFGLAKLLGRPANVPTLTGTHQVMGTPAYMAPEQMEGTRGVDHRADIFSLGVVFYELLTGELPLGRFALPSQKVHVDVRLDEVVLRTLEKEPDRRYQQASEVKSDVETIRTQSATARPLNGERPRHRWLSRPHSSWTRLAIIVLCCLPLFCILVPFWVYQSAMSVGEFVVDRLDNRGPAFAEKQAATERYLAELERQRAEQQRQKQAEEAASDPNEANALVQFTPNGVKLHPHAFGTDELTTEQRGTVEKVLTQIHREYLKVEAKHTQHTVDESFQITRIDGFYDDVARLENDLWTAVDTQLPVTAQKALRQRLPLFVDATVRLPQVAAADMGMAGGSAGAGSMTPSAYGSSAMGGPPGMMMPDGYGGTSFPSSLRYQQLLGWKQDLLPLRVTISRRGRWFRWEIANLVPQRFAGGIVQPTGEFSKLDTGEAPELPSGLRRFWREADSGVPADSTRQTSIPWGDSPEAVFQRAKHAHAARDWRMFADCFTAEARDELSFEYLIGSSLVYVLTEFAINSGTQQTQEALNANSRFKQFVQSLEKTYPSLNLETGEQKARLNAITEKLLQNRCSRTERRAISAQFIRETFGDQSPDFFVRATEFFHSTNPQVGGFEDLKLDLMEGNEAFGTYAARGAAKRQPIWFSRRDPGSGWMIDGLVDVSVLNQSAVSEGKPSTSSNDAVVSPKAKHSNDTPEAAFQREKQALAARRWQKYADCFTEEARNEFTLLMLIVIKSASDGESYNQLLESLGKAFPMLNLEGTELPAKLNTVTEKLRRSLPTRADFRATANQFIRDVFKEHARDCFARVAEIVKSELDAPDGVHLGVLKLQSTDGDEAFGIVVPSEDDEDPSHRIWFKFQEGEWKVDGLVDPSENWDSLFEDEEPQKASASTIPTEEHLNAMLLQMDKLRAADKTPWEEVEKRANELLAKYTAPADKGRIHWMAAHVYGQSDIGGHAADVIRHAKEAIKYERDPVQRGWLYMYLGNAAETLDSKPEHFVERRAEATRWYLKGYLELLPFNLPEKVPELPPVGKIGERFREVPAGEVDPEQVAAEVQQAAQRKARKDAEFTRELVHRREVYIGRLQDLFGRLHELYDKDADARGRLSGTVAEVLRDEAIVAAVLNRVWPETKE